MTSRLRIVLLLTALLIPTSLALASGAPSTPATPPTPAATLAQPLPLDTALSAAAPVCPRAALPAFTPSVQPLVNDICSGCSDAACAGKEEFAVCGVGFRCLSSPACTTQPPPTCQCKIIG